MQLMVNALSQAVSNAATMCFTWWWKMWLLPTLPPNTWLPKLN